MNVEKWLTIVLVDSIILDVGYQKLSTDFDFRYQKLSTQGGILMLIDKEYSLYYDEASNRFYQLVGDELWKKIHYVQVKNRKDNGSAYFDVFVFERNKFDTKYVLNKKKRKRFGVANVLAKLYVPNPENKKTVHFLDGDKSNTSIDNLCWRGASN